MSQSAKAQKALGVILLLALAVVIFLLWQTQVINTGNYGVISENRC